VDALISIIREEDRLVENSRVKMNAISRLGSYSSVWRGVRFLVDRIDEGGGQSKRDTWPLAMYPAARALLAVGVPARHAILGSLAEPVSEHKLHLMAYVLLELDKDDDMGLDSQMTVFRLMRELEQTRALAVAPERETQRSTKIKNLRRMIALLLEPDFQAKSIPPAPRPARGAEGPVGAESLLESVLREDRARSP
jgi:hypothetical protein